MELEQINGTTKRLTREMWLEEALHVLSQEGSGKLRIATITEALGVSKGSFYWHFKNRNDFLHALFEYWDEHFTQRVQQMAEMQGGSAQDRLRFVMTAVITEDLSGYDAAFDAWAAHEPDILPRVQKVYQFRYDYVQSLFKELGFRRDELDLRTQAFLGYIKLLSAHSPGGKQLPTKGKIEKRLDFFIRP